MTTLDADESFRRRMAKYPKSDVTFIAEPEREPLFCPIISADDHALEPATLFTDRLPSALRAHAPHVVAGEGGTQWWQIGDQLAPISLVDGAAGRPMSEWMVTASGFDEMRRAVWDPSERLRDMDLTGVWASLCFGSTVWGFAGTRFSKMSDPQLGYACLRAYNDWHLDEWCAADPARFIPCQLPWLADPALAADEIYRNAGRGFRAVSFSENPERLGFPDIYSSYWDPFLKACEETRTVVNIHVGSSGTTRLVSSSSHDAVTVALFPLSGYEALIDWVYAAIPLRFPDLTVALSEAGISWVPSALERLGRAYRMRSAVGKQWPGGDRTPTELVRQTFVFTSIEDPSGFQQLDLIGEDSVMVETDYPHFDSTWPQSQSMIRSQLSGLDPRVVRKVCYENAARIYRHPAPPLDLVARSEVGLG